jgi:nucleoside-diphosphate-sugar epimerase
MPLQLAVRKQRPESRATFAVGEIGPSTEWKQALGGVSCVVHLAARAHVMRETALNPIDEYRKVNMLGTVRLAWEAARAGVRRFVFLSSVKVNGESTTGRPPFTEADPARPQDAYAMSKWEAEQALQAIANETGMEAVILRSPLIYGPRVKGNFLSLLNAIDRRLPLPLRSIDNKRSLIFVGNLADAIIRCISHPRAAGQTFLVSDGEDVSTPELVTRIAKSLNRPPRLVALPPDVLYAAGRILGRRDSVERLAGSLQVDCSRIKRELEWQPPHSMEDGLLETAKWLRV